MAVYIEHVRNERPDIPRQHGLGRVVEHDDHSRMYAFTAPHAELRSIRHLRNPVLGILDQGNLGSCVGNAALGSMACEPYYTPVSQINRKYSWSEEGAVRCYSDCTKADEYRGTYPPSDTGSSGLGAGKALKTSGYITGYRHCFTLADALAAVALVPVITGIRWYSSFDNPDGNGLITRTAGAYVAGGHEIVADELDVEHRRVGFSNSWGAAWGLKGRFYMSYELWGDLLGEQGDVTVFTALDVPAPVPVPPTPVPPADADAVLRAAQNAWAKTKGLT
jgi:hypothetical protein